MEAQRTVRWLFDERQVVLVPNITGPFRKSIRSNTLQNLNCVEVAPTDNGIAMRDSKLGEQSPILFFDRAAAADFIGAIQNGDFDDFIPA